jgi:hypothetical protein
MIERGCCFSVKISRTISNEYHSMNRGIKCRDEEHKLDIVEMVKTIDCTRTQAQEDARRKTRM